MNKFLLSEITKDLVENFFENPVKYTSIYNSNLSQGKLDKIPDEIKEILNPIIEKLEKYNLNFISEGFFNGILFYRIEGLEHSSPEERYIFSSYILNLVKIRAKNIKFVEIVV